MSIRSHDSRGISDRWPPVRRLLLTGIRGVISAMASFLKYRSSMV